MARKQYRWLEKRNIPELRIQRPRTGRWVKPYRLKMRDIHVVHRRGPVSAPIGPGDLEKRAISHDRVRGSVHERIMYLALLKRKVPFSFQSSIQGGRLELGGMVADFILLDRPLIIRVQGTTWHATWAGERKDEAQKAVLRGMGYDVVDIWDWEIENQDLLELWLQRNVDVGLVR